MTVVSTDWYQTRDIYPLEPSHLQGVKVSVPARSDKILREEYGQKSLTNPRFHWYEISHKLFISLQR